eukprot:scaffold7068_cov301-Pinguiococcus_pyrenoidosus.AAC.18
MRIRWARITYVFNRLIRREDRDSANAPLSERDESLGSATLFRRQYERDSRTCRKLFTSLPPCRATTHSLGDILQRHGGDPTPAGFYRCTSASRESLLSFSSHWRHPLANWKAAEL